MGKKFYLINMLLLLFVVLLAVENYGEWTQSEPIAKKALLRGRGPQPPGGDLRDEKKETPAPPSLD